MYKHHEDSIKNLIEYFSGDEQILALFLGGSVAKGCERPDSDLDALVVVTEEKHAALAKENRLSECIGGKCTYEGGYFDVKYSTKAYLAAAAEDGSEPARNAFVAARCLFSRDEEIPALVGKIPVFQKALKEEKLLSFYSALMLNHHYFWNVMQDNTYLQLRTASDIVLFGMRLLLQDSEVFFPCHKALMQTVAKLERKPEGIVEKAETLMKTLDTQVKNDFIESILAFIEYTPPKNYSEILTRYTLDNELWWCNQRPVLAEW